MSTTTSCMPYTGEAKSEVEAFEITYPDADIILVSSDNRIFRLHQLLLSLSSPVFAGMLSIPQPEENQGNPDPVHLSEDGETILALCNIIYPDRKHADDLDLAVLSKVGAAAHKYQVDGAIDCLAKSLWEALHLGKDPLGVYAIASAHDLKNLAAAAAYASLSKPLSGDLSLEMDGVSGLAILKLQTYHTRRQKLIDDVLPAKVFSAELIGQDEGTLPWSTQGCKQCRRGVYKGIDLPLWFITFLLHVKEVFMVAPRGSSLRALGITGGVIRDRLANTSIPVGDNCHSRCYCLSKGDERLSGFLNRLAALLDNMLDQVNTFYLWISDK